jgi:acyl carrier protein
MDRREFSLYRPATPSAGAQQNQAGSKSFTKSQIAARVKQIAVEQLGVHEKYASPRALFIDDLRADSLDLAELVLAFETSFDIEICKGAAAKMQTVADAAALVERILRDAKRLAESDPKR